jgi:hypothetical protein
VKKNFFPDTDFSFMKTLPPIAELTFKMLKEKKEQSDKDTLKRKYEADNKTKLDDTMLGFQHTILPTADGCHPHITMSARSNKIDRFNSINPLLTDGETYDDGGDGEDDDDDGDDDDGKTSANKTFITKIDDDGTTHYKTKDGIKDVYYRKNAPQNGM